MATSIEAHLVSCPTCRDRLAARADRREVDAAWARLADAVDRPSPGPLVLLGRATRLGRFATGHRLVRSTIATPAMVAAALTAVALVVLVPLLAAAVAGDAALIALLVAAPLAPVAAAGIAYRDWADPAGEISLATPSAGLRLIAARALVVALAALLASTVALLLVGVWVELPAAMLLSWVLPGIALAALVMLTGTTRLDPLRVASVLSAGWAAVIVTGSVTGRDLSPQAVLDGIANPLTQAVALAVALTALLSTVARRDTVSYRRTA